MLPWQLFIDESGNFADDDEVCVVGVLIQERDRGRLSRHLRERFTMAAPHLESPLHAAEMHFPATHLDGWVRAPEDRRARHWRRDSLLTCERECRRAMGAMPAVRTLMQLAAEGARPRDRYELARDASSEIHDHLPRVHRTLTAVVEETDGLLRDVLADMSAVYGSARCHLVGAGDSLEDQLPASSPEQDRYLRALTCMFARVFALLRSESGERHRVVVWPATRDVDYGAPIGSAPLTRHAVERCIREAERFPLYRPRHAAEDTVAMCTSEPQTYGKDVSPGIVLADWCGNRLRRHLHMTSWPDVRKRLVRDVAIDVEAVARCTRGRPLPAIAATGVPDREVKNAFESRLGSAPAAAAAPIWRPSWTADQARRWIELAGQSRTP